MEEHDATCASTGESDIGSVCFDKDISDLCLSHPQFLGEMEYGDSFSQIVSGCNDVTDIGRVDLCGRGNRYGCVGVIHWCIISLLSCMSRLI